ncbi:MAG TPA: ornithine cyclodeaminase [Thermomicrobiaceae bacterium]|nr:ornithine cyclodeaminase [Thermomicrobiaceae bacterium]
MLALSREDVRALVPIATAIELLKEAFAELYRGEAIAPLRTGIEIPSESAVSLFMPAYVPSNQGLGLKIVSVFPNNPGRGQPTIYAIVVLIDAASGAPLALLDGTFLTALRTGAVSGAATDLLARDDSHVLTVIGAGAQGVTQAWAVAAVRPIEQIFVVDVNRSQAASFAGRLGELDGDLAAKVSVLVNADAAVRQSDVICTATTARAPVFSDAAIQPGTHINAVGAFTPEMQEIPAETLGRARLVVDTVEAAMAEAGDVLIAIKQGAIARDAVVEELGALASGALPGRTDPRQITIFKSVGNAIQDISVARYAVAAAQRAG